MSKVFSFRLDENNPREAQAEEVIKAWVSQGYSLRHVITEALLRLDSKDKGQYDLSLILEGLREVINVQKHIPETDSINIQQLPSGFIEAMRKTVKSGLKSNHSSNDLKSNSQ